MENKYILALVVIILVVTAGIFVFVSKESNSGNIEIGNNDNNAKFSGEVREFDIIAKQFSFEPSVIEVNEGDLVRLNVKSIDVRHGIAIYDFGVNEFFSQGQEVKVEFVADKKGEFIFSCSVYCGEGHGSMKGTLIVK